MKYSVVVTFNIEGFHNWPAAKDIFPEVAFLSDRHRHMFGFRCYAHVTHTDRDEEFILLNRKSRSLGRLGKWLCCRTRLGSIREDFEK